MKIINAWICQINNESINPIFGDLLIKNGKISSILRKDFNISVKNEIDKPDVIDAHGRVLTIPNVNYHDHIYSRLAKGLNITGDLSNFPNILKNLWWKLDSMLDLNMIDASAKMAALESIKHGVTYEIDHHSSPNSSKESLKTISDQLSFFKIRNVLCFETTDRNGVKLRDEGFSENINFKTKYANHNSKSLLGLHASFTLDEGSLKKASDLVKDYNWGVHVHLCEDISDVNISKSKYSLRPMQRFEKYALLNEKSILAHGIHLNEEDFKMIRDTGASLVFNIDSNMNNSVGLQKFNKIPKSIPILIGTDGMHANTARSLKELYLQLRHSGFSFDDSFEFIVKTYFDQYKFIKKYFDDFTSLNENERADFIIWDYVPPTPFHKENFWGHYIYGILERPIKTVVQYGEIILDDFKLNRINENSVLNEIYYQGEILSRKFNKE